MQENKQLMKLHKALNNLHDVTVSEDFQKEVPYDLLDTIYRLEYELHEVEKSLAKRNIERKVIR